MGLGRDSRLDLGGSHLDLGGSRLDLGGSRHAADDGEEDIRLGSDEEEEQEGSRGVDGEGGA